MKTSHVTLLGALILVGSSTWACGDRHASAADPAALEAQAVEAIWRMNEALVMRGILGVEGSYDGTLDGFSEAIEFFEGLTGIHANTETFVGHVPMPGLRAKLAEWNAWYDRHSAQLHLAGGDCRLVRSGGASSD